MFRHSDMVFEWATKRQIPAIKVPALLLVDWVAEELAATLKNCFTKVRGVGMKKKN